MSIGNCRKENGMSEGRPWHGIDVGDVGVVFIEHPRSRRPGNRHKPNLTRNIGILGISTLSLSKTHFSPIDYRITLQHA